MNSLISHSGAPPKSALADLGIEVLISGKPEIRCGEPGIHNPSAAEYGFRLSLTSFARPE
jgi:hypothetical protein